MKKVYLIVMISMLLLVVYSAPCLAGWLIFHKPAYTGKVIDAETRKPIEGAVVVAIYGTTDYIGGPGGPLSRKIHAKETLTDNKGEFRISSYTTVMGPISKEDWTKFIIYKPGYGSHPGRSIYPLEHIGPELLFSKEIGTNGEIYWGKKTISITYGIVELPPLKTWEKRRKAMPSRPIETTSKELPLLHKTINNERKRFGLRPVGGKLK